MKKYSRIVGFALVLCLTLSVGVFPIMNAVKAVEKVYKIYILEDETLPAGANSASSDVTLLGKLYSDAGHTVSFLDRATFADGQHFNASVCDILIIPTGEVFPLEAVANFKKFIADGGRVITMGGYAFSDLVDQSGHHIEVSLDHAAVLGKDYLLGSDTPIYAQDQLRFDPSQIPIFDEEHFYDSGVSIRPAEDQAVFSGMLNLSGDSLIQGYSAITTTGNYRGRWQPLIYAYDHVGTRVGTVGAIFRIYSQPSNEGALGMFQTWYDYNGTSIAFFGCTSHDLLAQGNEALQQGFVKLADVLMEDTYIASIDNKYDNYKQGEAPEFDIFVENGSTGLQQGTVELQIVAEDTGSVAATVIGTFDVAAKSRQTVHVKWDNTEFKDDFYQVNAVVKDRNGNVIDRYQTGFSVWDDAVIANGPKYSYEENYIKLQQPDGSYKAVFATGVDDGGNLLINEDQTPLVWKQEFIRRQDTGMYIYECLQQYRTAGDFAHLFASAESLEKHYRSVDNIVYLAQKYGQIYMMGIAIGDDVSASGAALDKIAEDVSTLATRYQSVPGIIYYLNGDLVCRISNEKNKAEFNDFLTARYGNSTNLNKAWGTFGLSLGNVDLDADYSYNGTGWSDAKAYDINLFKTTLITKWTSRLLNTIRQTGQADKMVLCEFYSWPSESVDIPLALGDMTYSNIGFFQTRQEFAQTLAYTDQRFQGKGFGIGETGRRTHPSFMESQLIYQSASYDESRDFFFTGLLSTYAMGGNHYQQWCWNDESKYVFPWGVNYTGDKAPRDLYYWFRNSNFVLKQTEPVYQAPQVGIILPDSTRASGSEVWFGGHYGAINALDVLQGTHVDSILTLNESNLIIDPNIKVIFYPMAYTMPQSVYDSLKAWVQQGGTLYISGDFAYDSVYRTRDHEYRLEELAGVQTVKVNYAGLDDLSFGTIKYTDGFNMRNGKPNLEIGLAGAQALYMAQGGLPVITQYALGSGNVIYSADPVEYADYSGRRQMNIALYRQVLDIAGVSYSMMQTDGENMKLFRQALADGGYFYELLNVADSAATASLNTAKHLYQFQVLGGNSDYVQETADGKLVAVFTEGDLSRDGQMILSNSAFAQVSTMDGLDLLDSKRIVVMPQQTGSIKVLSNANWNELMVRIGQVENGLWIDMGDVYFTYSDGYISFQVNENMVNAIILIGEKTDADSLREDGFGYMVADTLVIGGARGCVTAIENGGISLTYGAEPQSDVPVQQPQVVVNQEQKTTSPWVYVGMGAAVCVLTAAAIVWIIKRKKK